MLAIVTAETASGLHVSQVVRVRCPVHFLIQEDGIFVNGLDLFDVYLTTLQGTIKDKIEGLYFDQLVEWIDEKIEKIPAYSH